MTLQDEKLEKIRKQAEHKAREFADVFDNDVGKRVLADIKTEFDVQTICSDNPHETTIRAAQLDVDH